MLTQRSKYISSRDRVNKFTVQSLKCKFHRNKNVSVPICRKLIVLAACKTQKLKKVAKLLNFLPQLLVLGYYLLQIALLIAAYKGTGTLIFLILVKFAL